MEPEDLCNLVHVYEFDVMKLFKLRKILNDLTVEPVVPYTFQIISLEMLF